MTARRELVAALGLCLLGSALVLLALSRPWLSYRFGAAPPLPARQVDVAGTSLAPGARVLGLLGLAGLAGLPATRRLGRAAVGVLVAGAGAGVVAVVGRVLANPAAALRRAQVVGVDLRGGADLGRWPYVAMLGGLLLTAAGLLVVVRGGRWAAMSTRYDAPTASRPAAGVSLWEALDRGDDPTRTGAGSGD